MVVRDGVVGTERLILDGGNGSGSGSGEGVVEVYD